MRVSDYTIKAEALGNLFKNIGNASLKNRLRMY